MEHVILLHGLGGHGMTMSVIQKHITSKTNLTVHNWSYFSIFSSIKEIVDYISNRIEATFTSSDIINIVGHSLGGLIARGVIDKLDGKFTFNKVITIGTPHSGAVLANRILKFAPVVGEVSPIVVDLSRNSRTISTHPSFPTNIKHGAIVGIKKMNFYNPLLILSFVMMIGVKVSDGVVEATSAKDEPYTDMMVTREDHLSVLYSSNVMDGIINFLLYSKFSA